MLRYELTRKDPNGTEKKATTTLSDDARGADLYQHLKKQSYRLRQVENLSASRETAA